MILKTILRVAALLAFLAGLVWFIYGLNQPAPSGMFWSIQYAKTMQAFITAYLAVALANILFAPTLFMQDD